MECLSEYKYLELILNIIVCGLSFIVSLMVIFTIFKRELYQHYSFKILLYISINDLLRSLFGFFEFQVYENSFICSMYAFLVAYLFLSNMVWALCLTFTIYQIIVLEETFFEKHHKIWIFVSFILVAVKEALPFTTQSLGYNEGLCQITDDEIGTIWRFSLIFFPLFTLLILILILSHKIITKVDFIGNISVKALVLDRGLIYALIIALAVIPFFIIRIVQIFENSCLIKIS